VVMHVALGDTEKAFRLLFRAMDERQDWFPFIKSDPDYDRLHADPRWRVLLHRMNLDDD
jgi:hypothetical protein